MPRLAVVCHHCLRTNELDLAPPDVIRITCRGCQRRIYVHPRSAPDGAVEYSTTDSPVLPGRRARDRA